MSCSNSCSEVSSSCHGREQLDLTAGLLPPGANCLTTCHVMNWDAMLGGAVSISPGHFVPILSDLPMLFL